MLQVTESLLKKLLQSLGFKSSGTWSMKRLQSKLNSLFENKAELDTDGLEKTEKALLKKIQTSLRKKVPAIVVEDNSTSPQFLKGDKIIHGCGGVYRVVKSPYLVKTDIFINAIHLNVHGKSTGDIEQILVNDFTRDATKEDITNPPKGARVQTPKKSETKEVKKQRSKKEPKEKEEKKPRVSIGSTMYDYFNRVGVEKAEYNQARKLALKIKPESAFNENHLAWYKNVYRKEHDLDKPPRKKRSRASAAEGAKEIQDELKRRILKKKSKNKPAKKSVAKKNAKKVPKQKK